MYSVGIDIVEFKTIKLNKSIINRILTKDEYKQYQALKNIKLKKNYFYGRWCAKEAVFKALNIKIHPNSISITNNEYGKPLVEVKGFKIELSISHTKNFAVAVAIATKKI